MYSKQDKERILAEFHASGLWAAQFCKDPARPARATLKKWLEEEARGDLAVPKIEVRGACSHSKHARYPKTTVAEALRLLRGGMRPEAVARRLGVASGSTVRAWRRKDEAAKMAPKEALMDTDKRKRDGRRKESVPLREARQMSRRQLEEAYAEERMRSQVLLAVMLDPKAQGPESLSNRQKAELGQRLRLEFGLSLNSVLTLLGISRSTYYDNVAALMRTPGPSERDALVDELVGESFSGGRRAYGYRRVHADLKARHAESAVSEREVRRSMARLGLVPAKTRAKKHSSYAGEVDERPANLPLGERGRHDFTCDEPGGLVVTDVTEFKVGGTKVYLSPVVDCFDGLPLSHRASLHPDSALCDGSLVDAIGKGPVGVVHTDGGVCYRSASWKRICEEHGVLRSMSRKANCGDNARAEGFFGTLKEEFYNGRDWSQVSPERFMEELDRYIEWYRTGRLKAFKEDGKVVYDTIAGRRARMGLAA